MLGLHKLAQLPDWIALLSDLPAKRDRRDAQATVKVIHGQRNSTLMSYAGSMRYRNLPEREVLAQLLMINREQCKPPLDETEVKDIVRSAMSYDPSSIEVVSMTLNDAGNADRLVSTIVRDVRYVPELGVFIEWAGNCWKKSDSSGLLERAKVVLRRMAEEADLCQDLAIRRALRSHASSSLNHGRLRAACELAKTDSRLRLSHSKLDARPFLLPVANGVVDLKTGRLSTALKKHYMTRSTPIVFDPKAKRPSFKKFLYQIAGKDKSYANYLVRLMGYFLTGTTREQKFFFLHGAGANGKSTLLAVIRALLGSELVSALPADSLMLKARGRSSTNDLARLDGVRVVLSNEIEEGRQFDESMLKALTGGDLVTARFLYKEFVDFEPKFKLLIAGNHQPVIMGDDGGIWRRVELLPFNVHIPPEDRDPALLGKLKRELPGILALTVRGCVRWCKYGLGRPELVSDASSSYRAEMDTIGRWLADRGKVAQNQKWRASDAYANYRQWSEGGGLHPMSGAAFGTKIKNRFGSKRSKLGVIYLGIGPAAH